MKKEYQIPSVNVMFVHPLLMKETSLTKNETGADADVVLGKEDADEWGDTWEE